jgi:methyltransferase (TIGR00027 family)
MTERGASRTAEYMALFRALESARGAGRRLFEDPLAIRFLRARLRTVVRLSRLPGVGRLVPAFIDHRWPGARTSGVARTRLIDDVTDAALRAGIDQVVTLGAGFDARAYRMPGLARVTVFEVDHPATSAVKQALVRAALGRLPGHVRFVALDFDADPLDAVMQSAGFDARRVTLFLWEGVTNYLTEAAVASTLRWCASAAGGSRVVFTYVDRRVLDAPAAFVGTKALFDRLAESDERWTFGLEPAELSRYLQDCGLVLEDDVGARDYRAGYFGPAASSMTGYEFYRVAVARVSGADGACA